MAVVIDALSTPWLIVVVLAGTSLVTLAIYFGVMRAAAGPHGAALKALSPGMLPPNREASSLRSAELIVAATFPRETARIDRLIRRQIQNAAAKGWPAMADQRATLTLVPAPLGQALRLSLSLHPAGVGQATGQRELVTSLQNALDARRQRIIVSRSTVNWVKWLAVVVLAVLTLAAIACVHSDSRVTAAIAMGLFAGAVAITLVLIASQARPFSGEFGIKPDVLLQVQSARS